MLDEINEFVIHTDGGSRGNPGPAASAFIVEKGSKIIATSSKFIGITTNNVAEYTAVLLALEWIHKNHNGIFLHAKFQFVLDSELVVRQINGVYKIKDIKLKELFSKIKKLIENKNLETHFINVPRNKNKMADLLVNQELDNKTRT